MSENEVTDERLIIESSRPPRRATTTVERLVPPRRPTWSQTGEYEVEAISGIFDVPDPSAEHEVAPLVPLRRRRPRTAVERGVRVVTALLCLALVLAVFAQAFGLAARNLATGQEADQWREVPLIVRSSPTGAQVFVENNLRGRTLLRTTQRCRGRAIRVRVELPGYAIWQWSGLCMGGTLRLDARLQPLESR